MLVFARFDSTVDHFLGVISLLRNITVLQYTIITILLGTAELLDLDGSISCVMKRCQLMLHTCKLLWTLQTPVMSYRSKPGLF